MNKSDQTSQHPSQEFFFLHVRYDKDLRSVRNCSIRMDHTWKEGKRSESFILLYIYTHAYICMYVYMYFIKWQNWKRIERDQSLLYEIKGSGGYVEMDVSIENVYVECLLEISIDNREKSHEHSFNCFAYIHKLPQCVYDFIIICNANRRSTYTGNSRSNIRHYGLH